MKAAILESLDNLSVQEVPEPEIDDDAALMRIEAVSICGSDVRILHHGNPRVKPPTIIGHENSGVIVKTGKNVTRVKAGDRVSIGADVPLWAMPLVPKWTRKQLCHQLRHRLPNPRCFRTIYETSPSRLRGGTCYTLQ